MSRVSAVIARLSGEGGFFAGWRGLRNFWVTTAVSMGVIAGIVQIVGPPRPPAAASGDAAAGHSRGAGAQSAANGALGAQSTANRAVGARSAADGAPSVQPGTTASAQASRPAGLEQAGREQVGRADAGPIADPDPALLEPAEDGRNTLPRIADDGRKPMQVYAAGFNSSRPQPRIAILLAGFGLSETDSMRAARVLPGGVSFAVSPYGPSLAPSLAAARSAQHEYLLSIPMEPQGYPMNDPGNQGLMTNSGRAENLKRLLWSMSRFAGYVGVTGALGELRGERFAGLSDQMEPVLRQVARRGLLYVDPRPGQTYSPQVWSRIPDLIVDEPATAQSIDARLAELETIARERGSAMGLAGAPRPVTVDRIAVWTESLAAKGLALAPVSAVVQPPSRDAPNQAASAGEAGGGSDPAGSPGIARTAARSRTASE